MIAVWCGLTLAAPHRSAPPVVLPSPVLELPEPTVHELGPAAEGWYVHVPQVRKVAIDVVFGRGMIELEGGPTEELRALGWMADVAAGDLDAAALSEQRDLYDIEIGSSLGMHAGRVSLRVPLEELGRGVDLQELVLRDATFPKKELKRYLRDQELYYTVTGPSSQAAVARAALGFTWFPAEHPYGRRPVVADIDRVKGRDLRASYTRWKEEAPLTVVVVGDVAWGDIAPRVTALVAGIGRPGEPPDQLAFDPPAASRIVAVDMRGQEQVAVRFRLSAPWEDDPDRAAYETASWVLGGHFLARLNRVLREEKGYTYGADAWYQSGPTWGSFTVAVDVRPENLADTVRTIEAELAGLATTGPDEAELEMARRSLAAEWNDTFLTADTAARLYLDVLEESSSVAAHRARVAAVATFTPEDVRRVAAAWFDAAAPRVWVVVGDRAVVSGAIADMALPVTWTDPAFAILGTFQGAKTSGQHARAGER